MTQKNSRQTVREEKIPRRGATRGFSLLELMVATGVFLVVAGAAFSVFGRHVALTTKQEGLSSVNIGMRNAMSQMEIDLAGAGQNLLSTVINAPPFSLGVVVQNNVPGGGATACAVNTATWAYPTSSACFDSLTVIIPKPNAAVLDLADSENLSATSTMNASDPNLGADPTLAADLANDAAQFVTGDELLIVQPGSLANCQSGNYSSFCITTVTLTGPASVLTQSGTSVIQLPHNLAGAGGGPQGCPGATCTDPLGIIYSATHVANYPNALAASMSGTTYIINLGTGSNNITYAVQANAANAADTELVRCIGASCTGGNAQVLADQVIGFKVGAALWDYKQSTDIASFFYDSSLYCNGQSGVDCTLTPPPNNDPYDYSLVRSLRMSLIARTVPHADLSLGGFTNGFDNGPYMVQQASVVVDLHNMSMNDLKN